MTLPHRQRGISIVAAIFLLVVLSSLAVFIVRVSGVEHQTVNVALLGERAFQAARAGLEWGAFLAIDAAACTTTTLTLIEAGLNGFSVDVTCNSSSHTENNNAYSIFVIVAEARSGVYGTPGYVSRRMQATLTNAP